MVQSIGSLYFHGVVKGAPLIDGVALTRPAHTAFRAANASDGQLLVRNRLPEIQVPTLVLVGRYDFIYSPVQPQMLADGIPAARLYL